MKGFSAKSGLLMTVIVRTSEASSRLDFTRCFDKVFSRDDMAACAYAGEVTPLVRFRLN